MVYIIIKFYVGGIKYTTKKMAEFNVNDQS